MVGVSEKNHCREIFFVIVNLKNFKKVEKIETKKILIFYINC